MNQSINDNSKGAVVLSIVIPVHNEQENIAPLVQQVKETVVAKGINTELIIVDDGSTDDTRKSLLLEAENCPWVVALARDKGQGQSAAMYAGIQAARGEFVATLDGDLQNDPADLPLMLEKLKTEGADMVQGDRSRHRQDTFGRRIGSAVGRAARRWLIGDCVRDTGCSARVVRCSVAKQFPLAFKGMHRFMPAYAAMLGAKIIEMPVKHHPRQAGKTKYGVGVFSRGVAGFFDCLAVRWMKKRYRNCSVQKLREEN